MSDQEVQDGSRICAELRKLIDSHATLFAGEIARRSTPDKGKDGLLAKAGHRTVEEFLKVSTGMPGRDASTPTRVGNLTTGAAAPGLEKVGAAVVEGTVSAQAAEAIRAGLGTATDHLPPDLLDQAAERLCREAQVLDADRLLKRARELRDELDESGIHGREQALRAQRSLTFTRMRDGLSKTVWVMDPGTSEIVGQVDDRAPSPRRGGPRFTDGTKQAELAARIEAGERTIQHYASDAFTELLTQSAAVDETVLLKGQTPTVRVIVSATDLQEGSGHGVIQGSNEAVSIPTVERLACTHGITTYLVDSVGQILDQGRERRLYTPAQKAALALRDGGCMAPGCTRPPSFCEAHHIDEWDRKRGKTNLADGLLLCRHHHLKLHNDGHWITRRDDPYYWHTGPGQPPTMLETKSRAIREHLQRQRT